MTSFAMAIGMVPTAIGTGMGSEFRSPMAVAVIGGVITSTVLTLLVVPVVFYFFEKPYLMVEPFVRLLRFVTGRKAPVLVSAERQPEQAASARV
jgi:hypothetical protein